MLEAHVTDDKGNIWTFVLNPKTFKNSGNTGYHATGKAEIDGQRYQVNMILVRLRPKKREQ